jgi:hypothetical protein
MGDSAREPDSDPTNRIKALKSTFVAVARGTMSPTSCFRFLDLPPEIRNMIYKEVVVVGVVSFSPGNSNQKRPQLALLRVCKQIHAEAETLYLAGNLFRLPHDWYHCLPFSRSPKERLRHGRAVVPQLFSQTGLSLIRNLSFNFNTSQISTKSPGAIWNGYDDSHGAGSFSALTPYERGKLMMHWQHILIA